MRTADLRCTFLSLSTSLAALLTGACATDDAPAGEDAEAAATQALGTGTLSLVNEIKFSSIMPAPAAAHYEASGVQYHDGLLYVVFDNMTRIGKVNPSLTSASYTSGGAETNSQYESITFDSNNTEHFYIGAETADHQIVQLDSAGDGSSASTQATNVSFGNTNTGLEGLAWVWRNNNDYLLGLCEGINCGTSTGTPRRGAILVMSQVSGGWQASTTLLQLPSAVQFADYSDLALTLNGDGSYKVAVTSQESKKLWIGTLSATSWSFIGDGTVYPMPSADYCNVEGVTFISPTRVALVSDLNKNGGTCSNKDQMIHIFDL